MVFLFFNMDSTANMLGMLFIVLNIILAIFAVCLNNGKFIYKDLLLRFHMIMILFLIGCLLFPLGTLVIGDMALTSIYKQR